MRVRDAARVLKDHIGQYVFISTISAYAANDKPADETAPLAVYAGEDAIAETSESLKANPKLYGPLKALSETEALARYGEAAATIRAARPRELTPVNLRANAGGRPHWHPALALCQLTLSGYGHRTSVCDGDFWMAEPEVIAATLAAALLRRPGGPPQIEAVAGGLATSNNAATRQAVLLYKTTLGMLADRPASPT